MTHSRSIAVAQTCPVKGDVLANLDEHVRLARLAATEGAAVVVFPELSLTGYELTLAADLAFSEGDPRLAPLLDVATGHGTILVVGAPVRVGASLYIGAFILFPDRTSGLYTKHHLGAFPASAICDSCDRTVPPAEATVFRPGDRNPLIRYGGNIAAVAICADIGRLAHPQRAADRDAEIYLASMFVIPSDLEGEFSKLRRYAAHDRMMTALANFGGPSRWPQVWGPKCDLVRDGRTAGTSGGERLWRCRCHGDARRLLEPSDHGQRLGNGQMPGLTAGTGGTRRLFDGSQFDSPGVHSAVALHRCCIRYLHQKAPGIAPGNRSNWCKSSNPRKPSKTASPDL